MLTRIEAMELNFTDAEMKILIAFLSEDGEFEDDPLPDDFEKFEGWKLTISQGKFDYEKSGSYDHTFTLVAPTGHKYKAVGGWYHDEWLFYDEGLNFKEVIPKGKRGGSGKRKVCPHCGHLL